MNSINFLKKIKDGDLVSFLPKDMDEVYYKGIIFSNCSKIFFIYHHTSPWHLKIWNIISSNIKRANGIYTIHTI